MRKVNVFSLLKNVLIISIAIGILLLILQSFAFAENIVSFDDSNEASFSTLKQAPLRSKGVTFFSETGSKLNSLGMSKLWFGRNEYMKAEIGFSISRLEFKDKPKDFVYEYYYPLYGLFHVEMNYPVAPFMEFGLDLGDALLANGLFGMDEVSDGCCDVNLSIGLETSFFRSLSLSIYGKFYQIRYMPNDQLNAGDKRSDFFPIVAGLRLAYWY